ncbi:MAG TPA: AAA family ATPase [Candidatus Binatia bacterium]|nr:AAA family ATPase [Candidatus Binatia bacterium]
MLEDAYTIITGGPHSGKSTLTRRLRECGYVAIGEIARPLIRLHERYGGPLPWTNNYEFQRSILPRQIAREERHRARENRGQPRFSERGHPDSRGYSRFWKHPLPPEVDAAIAQRRYHPRVFFLESIPGYRNDSQRKELADETPHLTRLIFEGYQEAGYALEVVPVMPLDERVAFICKVTNGKRR